MTKQYTVTLQRATPPNKLQFLMGELDKTPGLKTELKSGPTVIDLVLVVHFTKEEITELDTFALGLFIGQLLQS